MRYTGQVCWIAAVIAAALAGVANGCSEEESATPPPARGGSSGSAGADASPDGSSGASGKDATVDATKEGDSAALCGNQVCLPGETCEQGACVCAGSSCSKACCAGTQVCYLEVCTQPGADCLESHQCAQGEYCEQTIQKCLPSGGLTQCEYKPPQGVFAPELFWSWPQGDTPQPEYYQIIATPIVIALNPEGGSLRVPAVVFLAGMSIQNAHLRAVRGDNGKDVFHNQEDVFVGQSQLAAGDLDGDGTVEIVGLLEGTSSYCGYVGLHEGAHLAGFGPDGKRLWVSSETVHAGAGAPALADLNGDGKSEIVVGDSVFDATGKRLWVATHGPGIDGCLQAAAVNIVADIVGDTVPEVIVGATAYSATGAVLWRGMQQGALVPDGIPAVADLDKDGSPEVVVVHGGSHGLSILKGTTGDRICSAPGPSSATLGGGPPVIADFDGDGTPEIGVVYAGTYTAYEPDCTVKWSLSVQDQSGMTSSSVFDFDGDGPAEVVYTDESLVHVLKGLDGKTLFTLNHQSGTGLENPVVADIDADGHTEIVAVGQQNPSLQAFRDTARNWVASRRVWNQHAYHVTNVDENGAIPALETKSWLAPRVNSYRANVQAAGAFDVPNLQLGDLSTTAASCPSALTAQVRVFNRGARGVLPPILVRFTLLLQQEVISTKDVNTTHTLLPGESEQVSVTLPLKAGVLTGYQVIAEVDPDTGNGFGAVRECDETDNKAGPVAAACPSGPK